MHCRMSCPAPRYEPRRSVSSIFAPLPSPLIAPATCIFLFLVVDVTQVGSLTVTVHRLWSATGAVRPTSMRAHATVCVPTWTTALKAHCGIHPYCHTRGYFRFLFLGRGPGHERTLFLVFGVYYRCILTPFVKPDPLGRVLLGQGLAGNLQKIDQNQNTSF